MGWMNVDIIRQMVDAAFKMHPEVPKYSSIDIQEGIEPTYFVIRVIGPKPHSYGFAFLTSRSLPSGSAMWYSSIFKMAEDHVADVAKNYSAPVLVPLGATGCYSYNDNDVPATYMGKSVTDICQDFADSLRYASDKLLSPTSWGTALSIHKAEAVKAAYTSGPVTTIIFKNGKKVQVRKSENDLLNAEKGLAMCVCKAILEKDDYETLCKYAGKGAVITLAKFLMSPPEYAKLKNDIWKRFE